MQFEDRPLSDEEFLALCNRYPDFLLESTAEGDVIFTPPAHPDSGHRNANIVHQLYAWAEVDGRGRVFDSSTGFFLANGARRSPDSAWVSNEQLRGVTSERARWYVTPEFVIELRSNYDRLPALLEKMHEWISNGVSLGWLIDPARKAIEIYRQGQPPETVEQPVELAAGSPVEGFVLHCAALWRE